MRSLLWIVIIIIVYGSLYPFNFVWTDVAEISWLDWGANIEQRTTNGDVLSNFLTFIPFGFLAYFYQPMLTKSPFFRVALITTISLIFAYLLQVAQFFLPTRVPTAGDALINLWGTITGLIGAIVLQKLLIRNPELESEWPQEYASQLVLVICWCLYCLFPYFPELTLSNALSSIQPLIEMPVIDWKEGVFFMVFWWCFFDFIRINPWKKITPLVLMTVLFALLSGKIIIANNSLDLTLVVAALLGLFLALIDGLKKTKLPILLAIIVALIVRNLLAEAQTSYFNWMPFELYLSGSMWTNTQVFLEKLFVYGCLLSYMQYNVRGHLKGIVIALSIVIGIEILQVVNNTGVGDITDPILLIMIAYAFFQISKPLLLSSIVIKPAEKSSEQII